MGSLQRAWAVGGQVQACPRRARQGSLFMLAGDGAAAAAAAAAAGQKGHRPGRCAARRGAPAGGGRGRLGWPGAAAGAWEVHGQLLPYPRLASPRTALQVQGLIVELQLWQLQQTETADRLGISSARLGSARLNTGMR